MARIELLPIELGNEVLSGIKADRHSSLLCVVASPFQIGQSLNILRHSPKDIYNDQPLDGVAMVL